MNFESGFLSRLKRAKKFVFFTGAGISAESGIPTFRGKEGIWNKFKPEELANFDAFIKNPDMVWEWYQYRRKIVGNAAPNKAHETIVEFEKLYDVTVVTQNVDNLHRRAGSTHVYELHGNIEKNYCVKCRTHFDIPFSEEPKGVPVCDCGGLIRPDVVWFGELLPHDQYQGAEEASEDCDVFFIVGTSALVYPAAYLPDIARRAGSMLVEVNIGATEISDRCDYSFYDKAGTVLPELFEALAAHSLN